MAIDISPLYVKDKLRFHLSCAKAHSSHTFAARCHTCAQILTCVGAIRLSFTVLGCSKRFGVVPHCGLPIAHPPPMIGTDKHRNDKDFAAFNYGLRRVQASQILAMKAEDPNVLDNAQQSRRSMQISFKVSGWQSASGSWDKGTRGRVQCFSNAQRPSIGC